MGWDKILLPVAGIFKRLLKCKHELLENRVYVHIRPGI
jgi:hypothetical protein